MNRNLVLPALLIVSSISIAQAPSPQTGEVVMKTAIGSFKMVSPGDQKAFGKLEMTFKGTVLFVGLDASAPVVAEGNLRKEYDNKDRARVLYHGSGRMVVNGKFKSIQWFGRDLSCRFNGMSIVRVYGEFDKNGQTGTYQITGDKERYWQQGGLTFTVPKPDFNKTVAPPKVRIGN